MAKPSSTKLVSVNHPPHYTGGKIEVWDFIIDQGMNYLEGNVVKYLARYKSKNGLEDLLKAQAYLDKLIGCYSEKK
jgi:glutamate mutase epsilon subunit